MNPNIFHSIDYLKHPEFRTLSPRYSYNESEIEKIIDEINSLYVYLVSQPNFGVYKTIYRDLEKLFFDLSNEITKQITDPSYKKTLENIIGATKDVTVFQISFALKQRNFFSNKLEETERFHLNELIQKGYSEYKFESDDILKIKNISLELLHLSQKHYQNRESWRGARPISQTSKSGALFGKLIAKHNIEKIISSYKKTPMKVTYLGLDYAHERQTWHRGCYSPENNSADTNYFHIDDGINVCKMMIYLTDVSPENGPFSIIKKNNLIPPNHIKKNLALCVDQGLGTLVKNITFPFDYYRPIFKDHKQLFIDLPFALQMTTHFGDDILSGSSEANELIASSNVFTGNIGQAIIFDGHNCIHKGGTVYSGERLALQIGFIDIGSFNVKNRLKSVLKGSNLIAPLLLKIKSNPLI